MFPHSQTVLIVFIIFKTALLQTKGDFTCHCKSSDCHPTATPCPSGCVPGWEGPFCQRQNLAYNKPASQSGVYVDKSDCDPENQALRSYCGPHGAQLAVDGNDSTDYYHGSCAVTDSNSQSAWWKIDLQQEYNIANVIIYQRNHVLLPPAYIEVLVDNTTCYNVTGSNVHDVIINVTCHYSLPGSSVTLRTSVSSQTSFPSLTLCEVKIFECSNFWFGNSCQYRCHCGNTLEVCNKTTGACASGCASGWRGSSCQKNNIALHKQADQSGTFNNTANCTDSPSVHCGPRFASFAVDGSRDQNIQHGSCSQTASGRAITSWSLNLGNLYEIYKMRIYLPEHEMYSTSGIKIEVNNNVVCFSSAAPISNITDITCHTPIQGIFVSIVLPAMNVTGVDDRVLILCEVEIYECDDFLFGDNCDHVCQCHDSSEVCSKVSGRCPRSGCGAGWTGPDCQTECPVGTYGVNCSTECGQCANNSACDPVSGQCPALCRPGFTGKLCTDCLPGLYGLDCDQTCMGCPNNGSCYRYNGTCITGCPAHFTGRQCKACLDGWFGTGCEYMCGECLNDAPCDSTTGKCPNGCDLGWQGTLCKQECPDGTYGAACNETCSHCRDPVPCDKMTGICLGECLEGWTGDKCDSCDPDVYTASCNVTCGHCLDSNTCDHVTGKCPEGCMTGWTGDNCKTALTSASLTSVPTTPPPSQSTTPITTQTATAPVVHKLSTTTRTSRVMTSRTTVSNTKATTTALRNQHTTSETHNGNNSQHGLSKGVVAAIVISCILVLCISLHSLIFIRYSRRSPCRRGRRKATGFDHIESASDFTSTELPKLG